MHVLHAHHEPQSLNGDLTRQAVTTLTGSGHTVHVSDLYAMGFNPVTDASDYTTGEEVAPDIASEQQKIRAADLLILQYLT